MSQNAGRIDLSGNDVRKAGPGDMIMDQKKRYVVAGAGNQTIPAVAILSGIVARTGIVANNADVFDTADNIMAACPGLDQGDAFEFLLDQGAAFTNTPTAGAGITLVNANIAASNVRRYMVTCLAAGRTNIQQVNKTNGNAVLTLAGINGFPTPSQASTIAKQIQPGMLVTGTGIPGGTTVIAVNPTAGTVTMSANATDGLTVAATFIPSIEIRGLYQAAA